MSGRLYPRPARLGRRNQSAALQNAAARKRGFTVTKNRIARCLTALVLACMLVMLVAVPLASAASYSKVYGQTQDKIRVRESASTNATIIDNIVKGACVYVTSSNTSGSTTFVQIKYRAADGEIATGWACQNNGKNTYIKILSADQAKKTFSVSDGNLPSKNVGTFTAAERKASASNSDSTYIKLNSSGSAVKDMQTKLQKLGIYTAELTGNCGPKTVAAIKAFQEKYGLTADGVAGPATLAKIDAAYNALGSSSSSTATSSASGLKLNSTGKEVSALQTDLTTLGYYWAQITGNFGEKTETAVKRFQEENGLTVDGVAGKKTLDAIAAAVAKKGGSSAGTTTSTTGSVLRLNSQGTKVSQLQTDLKQLGYYYAEITGNFGEKTEAAVKDFQKKNGLSADGVAGANTLAAIAAAVEKAGGSVSGSGSSGSGLKLGSTGKEVGDLQENLTTLGYYYGDITNHFGTMTQAAVMKFQKSRGLTQDGIAGTKTLAAIASAVEGTGSTPAGTTGIALREGDSGTKVTDLQTRLKSLKYYYGDITGSFGSLTKQAVKKFQEANNLTVDGVAGTATLNKLYALTGGGSTSGSSSSEGSGTTVTTDSSYGRVIKNNVYLRSSANTSSAAKASLKQGTLVRISKIYTGSDGVKWYYVSVSVGSYTYKGYIRSDMMETITEEEYNKAGGNSSNNSGDQEVLGMLLVTGTSVRLRYSPSTSAETVGTANKGDVFYYVDSVSGWYQTKAGYWISSTYARPMTADEIKNYTGNGDPSTTYRYGSTGSGVTYIQTALTALKYYTAEITGHFGSKTEDAVKRFQKDNGLTADGVVGQTTMDKINAKYSSGAGSTVTVGLESTIYNVSWTKYKDTMIKYGLSKAYSDKGNVYLTDLETGKSFKVHVQSTGNHADVEPLTATDTKTMCAIYGVGAASQINYKRRAMILTLDQGSGVKLQFVCSVYGEVHGNQDIKDNNYDGQFCVHFLNSTIHSGDHGNIPDSENHQAIIANAVESLKKKTAADGKTITILDTLL